MLLALLLTACPEPEETGDSVVIEDTEPPAALTCEPAAIKFDGNEEPRVGDLWKFWLTCDDAMQMGASKTSIDPVDAGTLAAGANTPEITWAKAGEATLHIQTGRFKGDLVVTVLEKGS